MQATKRDIMASAIIHANMMLYCLDEVAKDQDLFKQDYKQLVRRFISETELRLNKIVAAMSDEERTAYFELNQEKTSVYELIDSISTMAQITFYRNQLEMASKIEFEKV